MTKRISPVAERAAELHPMAAKVARAASRQKQLSDCTPTQARALREALGNPFAPAACDMQSISDHWLASSAGQLRVRRYQPVGLESARHPALLFFHGGGHVLGTLDGYDTVAQQLARLGNCLVFSVEYRLAPETRSAGIYQDGLDAYKWLLNTGVEQGVDTSRIAIGGDSAGGNIAIAVMLQCKQQGIVHPCFQVQIYPAVDYRLDHPSIDEFAEGYFLTKANKQWFRSHFLESEQRAFDPLVSSLLADLSGLPAALVITAGFDPLRDEGEAYAQLLAKQGVDVEHVCYTDMIHAFVSFAGGIPAGMTALEKIGETLRRIFAR
ncbi:MAG: alpha/beta hydrolase [Pseudohongiellaceae bacterium]